MGEEHARSRFLNALIRDYRTMLAFWLLRKVARHEPGYAHAWHQQVARCAAQAGADPVMADMVGERFTSLAFGVDTSQ